MKKESEPVAKDSNASQDARERARQIAAKQAKASTNTSRRWIQLTVIAVVVAIIAIVATVVINSNNNKIAEDGPVPSSANQYGGIVLTKDGIEQGTSTEESRTFSALGTATASITPSDGASAQALPLGLATAEEAAGNSQPVRLTVFQDYRCVHCAEFETNNGDAIQQLVDEGKITLEIRNLTFLDASSPTQYSARAANAAYAVANQASTDQFLDFQKEIFSHQATGGVSNEELIKIAAKYGADIKSDVENNTWRPLVEVVTAESASNGVAGTPTIIADGQSYNASGADFTTWINGIIDAKKA